MFLKAVCKHPFARLAKEKAPYIEVKGAKRRLVVPMICMKCGVKMSIYHGDSFSDVGSCPDDLLTTFSAVCETVLGF